MPSNIINKVISKCDKSKEEVEELWDEAEKQAEEAGEKENYAYITGIFKKMLGKDCLKKLNWIEENKKMNIEEKIEFYLNES